MSSAILTLIGLYTYDHTLFDNIELPDGIEKDLVIDSIIMRGGEYEVMYPNPDLLKEAIGSWSKRWKNVFYNWKRATDDMDDINPLDNYDRYEEWEDTGTNQSHSIDVMNGSGSTLGHDSSNGSGNVTSTDKISADDSNSFVNKTQNTQSNTTNITADTSTSSSTNTNSTADTNGTTNSKHTGHLRGNIGITTSSTMYKEFIEVMRDYGNIYEAIAYVFCNAFVIPIL